MNGGVITANTSLSASCVSIINSAFTMSGGEIIGNNAYYGDIWVSNTNLFTLSLDAKAGVVVLASGACINIDDWEGSIEEINLFEPDMFMLDSWAGSQIITAASGSLSALAIAYFNSKLGFFDNFWDARQSISDTHYINNNGVLVVNSEPAGITIEIKTMEEWALLPDPAQTVDANTNVTFTASSGYSIYQWYINGALQTGGGATFTFNRPAGIYELVVVVTDADGDTRSGRCRVTALR